MKQGIAHLDEAIRYLRGCENSEIVVPLITMTRSLREKFFFVQKNLLPVRPGQEK